MEEHVQSVNECNLKNHIQIRKNLTKQKLRAICRVEKAGILSKTEISSCKCDSCGYNPLRKYDLRMHKASRTCERNKATRALSGSKCSICGQSFNSKGNLERHQRSRHNINQIGEGTKQRYNNPMNKDMLDSTIEDLMKEVGHHRAKVELGGIRHEKDNLGNEMVKEDKETGPSLVICGVVPTLHGKVSVVRPQNMKPKKVTFATGLTKLKELMPRLLKREITLTTLIEVTRLPPIIVVNWIQALLISLPPE